ncbi:hypothetical protein DOTSEDRAFT_51275 [Dothistroma septosporum NZE10]|uniref:SAC domain-containing protein n=1 Tax=Dothistroma septosporum (strain NZE10 / CBS 128990) TaxID=675120 RepID=N1Q039_DOTSN|nr:hypothetical protein DOTSEDRAFT_51275 [Dothistroma septosporum NZE10]
MPGLARKLLIFATVDGLFLQHVGQRASSIDASGIQVGYGSKSITTASQKDENIESGLEVHGIVGLLDLVSSSYLIAITKREPVAQIRQKTIFRITDVALIPLESRDEAQKSINAVRKLLQQKATKSSTGETEDECSDDDASSIVSVDDVDDAPASTQKEDPKGEVKALEPPKPGALQKSSTFVKDVVQDKGKYGRFASKWFTKNGSKDAVTRQQGWTDGKNEGGLTKEQQDKMTKALPEGQSAEEKQRKDANKGETEGTNTSTTPRRHTTIEHLTPRILRSTRLYFSSSGFYFSYDHDLSNSLAQHSRTTSDLPLWKRFDPLFFWNRHLLSSFVEANQDSLVLPLLQGFVGQRAFSVDRTAGTASRIVAEAAHDVTEAIEMQDTKADADKRADSTKHDLVLTIISRRPVKRAGLRYLRRGIDDDGNVANNVETEQILSSQSWDDSEKTFSLLQTRGSIPLFFSQSPYSFKPLPVMFGSEATNQAAFRKHFEAVGKRYGSVQCASLIDKHGTELNVGEVYEKQARLLNEHGGVDGNQIGFEWFDFHGACKGMKFENIQMLLDSLQGQLNSFGWLVKQNNRNIRQQTGILRTNCMDCLDRTNVTQSAVAGWALQQQLAELGLNIDLKTDPKTQWFNTLWADNGDAISKQYAGTSALKGDFTRTRKRNWTGALSDFSLTLTRYYNNIFGDYFLQTSIDYYLGNAGPSVFDDFETDMVSPDYALDMRHIRQNAIDTCIKIVLEDPHEELKAGWTLSCPRISDTLRSLPIEECVLLLTGKALYFCRFNWDTEEVGSFERVELLDIQEIWRGAYITSALGGTHLDEARNTGFALRYNFKGPMAIRTNTRSLSIAAGAQTEEGDDQKDESHDSSNRSKKDDKSTQGETIRTLAFKALSPKAVAAKDDTDHLSSMSEQEIMKHITDEIQKNLSAAFVQDRGFQHIQTEKPPSVQEKDIISVAEAKRSTGYIEGLGYGIKKLIWS